MSVKVASNRFIVSSLIQGAESYQHVINSVSSFQELGGRLVQEIETARVFRQVQRIEDLSLILSNLPIREYQLIGQYYCALSSFLKGDNTQHTFEMVLDESRTYKANALITLAGIEAHKGNTEAELKYFAKAAKYAHSPSLLIEIYRGAAIVKAKEGCHGQTVKELEEIYPLIRHTDFYTQCQYFNSLAVEFTEVGKLDEAERIIQIVLASPYAFAYPEWRETSNDIALRGYKSRSVIYFDAWNIARNVLYLPENSQEESTQSQPGTVSALEDWKKKMVKEPNGEDELPENMTRQDMAMKILEMITEHKDDEEKLRQLVEYAMKLFSK